MNRSSVVTSTIAGKKVQRTAAVARPDQLRPLNLPQPVKVELDDVGVPSVITEFCSAGVFSPCNTANNEMENNATKSFILEKHVESVIEIWHVDDEWWRKPISRRCVEVILRGGKHVVLYEDLTTGDWFMQRP